MSDYELEARKRKIKEWQAEIVRLQQHIEWYQKAIEQERNAKSDETL